MRWWLLAMALGGAVGALWWQAHLREVDTRLDVLVTWQPPTVSIVTDRHGQEIDRFYTERRQVLSLDALPEVVWRAVLAAEDQRFFSHHGVDGVGIARAVQVNLDAGEVREGGSTLTQQLVKNRVVGDAVTFRRKADEAVLAWRLEQRLSKRQILELYLNDIYLGDGNYGLEAAAWDYFGCPAQALDAGQAATLASIIPAPSRSSPRDDLVAARARRDRVLEAMVGAGWLSAHQGAQHTAAPLVVLPPRAIPPPVTGASYITEVRRQLREQLGALPDSLQLRTALDPELQALAARAVTDAAAALEGRQGQVLASAGCLEAVVGRPGGPVTVAGERRSLGRRQWQRAIHTPSGPRALRWMVRSGDVLPVCPDEQGALVVELTGWVQGAAAVIDNPTGEVLALVGGLDEQLEGFSRATQAVRQPGSSFKPYVYAAALRSGLTQVDTVLDAPLKVPDGGGGVWEPQNYSGTFSGAHLTLRQALARSVNSAAVRLTLQLTPRQVAATARRMGVRTPLRSTPPISLGASEVTVLDQAVAYSTIARMGVAREPVLIAAVEDAHGALLAGPGQTWQGLHLPGGEGEAVLTEAQAWQLVEILQEVLVSGTGRDAWRAGAARAGKTGTTNDFVDAWFVGFTPQHTVAVWIGADDRTPLGPGETGSVAALPAWAAIVDGLGDGGDFRVPDSVVRIPWQDSLIGLPRDSAQARHLLER